MAVFIEECTEEDSLTRVVLARFLTVTKTEICA
jgi:hypothetical protein